MQAKTALQTINRAETFGEVVQALQDRRDIVVLSDANREAMVAVSPKLQGRVLTSTAGGNEGRSFGWVNHELIRSGETREHFNAYGGEDRLWLGPEGGQFSIFFAPGASFDLKHWYTPASLDTQPFEMISVSNHEAVLQSRFRVTNYSSAIFDVQIDRSLVLLSSDSIWSALGSSPFSGVNLVGFESRNKLTNDGSEPWRKSNGLLSIWVLGQFQASPQSMILIPLRRCDEANLEAGVTSDYFGSIPPDRLIVQSNAIFLRADAKYRSKVGICPSRATGILGSYDSHNRVLTIVQHTLQPGAVDFVNSLWKIQLDPFKGDVVNAYNDGPAVDGANGLGDFYELESSSPAAELDPGKSLHHVHRTIHIQGEVGALDEIARRTLGLTLPNIRGKQQVART